MLGFIWKGFGMVSEEPLNKFGMELEDSLYAFAMMLGECLN